MHESRVKASCRESLVAVSEDRPIGPCGGDLAPARWRGGKGRSVAASTGWGGVGGTSGLVGSILEEAVGIAPGSAWGTGGGGADVVAMEVVAGEDPGVVEGWNRAKGMMECLGA